MFHYTTFGAFRSIIDDGELWATDLLYLNDEKEFELGIELVSEVIFQVTRTMRRAAAKEGNRKFLSYISSAVANQTRRAQFGGEKSTYIAAFSGKEDDLSQWRAYGSSELGISIGFHLGKLRESIHQVENASLEKCEYSKDVQLDKIKQLTFDWIVNEISESAGDVVDFEEIVSGNYEVPHHLWRHSSVRGQVGGMNIDSLLSELEPIVSTYKDASFADEGEFRLVISTPCKLQTQFRLSNRFVAPFVRFPLRVRNNKLLPIKSITIGPNPHSELNERAVKKIVEGHPYLEGVSVKKSKTPYRNW